MMKECRRYYPIWCRSLPLARENMCKFNATCTLRITEQSLDIMNGIKTVQILCLCPWAGRRDQDTLSNIQTSTTSGMLKYYCLLWYHMRHVSVVQLMFSVSEILGTGKSRSTQPEAWHTRLEPDRLSHSKLAARLSSRNNLVGNLCSPRNKKTSFHPYDPLRRSVKAFGYHIKSLNHSCYPMILASLIYSLY